MHKKIIVDADLCLKLGNSEKYRFLEEVLPLVAEKIYIHTKAFDEIMYPQSAVSQIRSLIATGKVEVVNESLLETQDRAVFDMAYRNLASVMLDPRKPREHCGEVYSLAYAKAVGIPIFATDESALQPIIDNMLNTGINDIYCLRITNIVEMIHSKEIDLPRKLAKALWRIAGKSSEVFDTDIWPIMNDN